jgi:3-oxoadipate enol-lactonase
MLHSQNMKAGSTDSPSVNVWTTKIDRTVQATRPVWAMVTAGGYHIHEMAEPLVLVPGLDGTGLLFYRQVPLLERRYRVATHRLRDTAVAIDELVSELHDRVTEVAPDARVTLVGESFGGALSLTYALAHPERVARLVVLNSFPFFTPQARLWLGYHLLRAAPWGVMRVVRQMTAWRMHSPHTGRAELRRFHELMRATTREGYLSRLRMLRQYDVRARLADLQAPVLYLAADRDHLVPAVEQARLMASLTPGSAMRVLEGHGHICLIAPDLDLCTILEEWTSPT